MGANNSDTAFTDSIEPNGSPALIVRPTSGQLDEDDVAELLLREVGDADFRGVPGDADPLVVFRVLQVRRDSHPSRAIVLL